MTEEKNLKSLIHHLLFKIQKLEAEKSSLLKLTSVGLSYATSNNPEIMQAFMIGEIDATDDMKDLDEETNLDVKRINEKIASYKRLLSAFRTLVQSYKINKVAKRDIKELMEEFKTLKTLPAKIKWVLTVEATLMTAPEVIEALRGYGEGYKPNTPEFTEEYKKTLSSVSATMKIYTDNKQLDRCHLPGSQLYYYGLPAFFSDGEPREEYVPEVPGITKSEQPIDLQIDKILNDDKTN